MYLEFFNIKEYPFRLTPDMDFLFMSKAHARAKAYMDYSVWCPEGFVVITGEVGCGKTTLIQKLLSELDDNVTVAKIFQTQLDEVELLQAILVEFGLNPFNAKKVELMDMLNTFLIDNFQQMKQAVLIVDEAHNLSARALEEIRLLSGVETHKEKVLHVILVGQPQLSEMLETPEMEQLLQRVSMRYHIKALEEEDVGQYVRHRLQVAGDKGNIFKPEVFPLIYKFTGGIPRLINTLCDTALTCAYAENVHSVNEVILNAAVEELQWLPYSKRVNQKRAGTESVKARESMVMMREQGALLANINDKLGQVDSLQPVLTGVSRHMANIESLMREIVVLLRGNRPAPMSEPKKRSSK